MRECAGVGGGVGVSERMSEWLSERVFRNTACPASEYQRHACAFSQVQVSKAARKEAGQLKTQLTEISSNLKATVQELDKEKSSGETHHLQPHTVSYTQCM